MAIPKCAACEHYATGYGRIPFSLCRKAAKPINKIGGYKTSPMWCPLRKKEENDG